MLLFVSIKYKKILVLITDIKLNALLLLFKNKVDGAKLNSILQLKMVTYIQKIRLLSVRGLVKYSLLYVELLKRYTRSTECSVWIGPRVNGLRSRSSDCVTIVNSSICRVHKYLANHVLLLRIEFNVLEVCILIRWILVIPHQNFQELRNAFVLK